MTDRTEYGELRATIRERGTARIWIFVVGMIGWAGAALAVVSLGLPPLFALVPLLVLGATFEAVYALHIGAERIGRYLEVFHEAETPGWETRTKWFAPGAQIDALFTVIFIVAGFVTTFTVNLYGATLQENLIVEVPWALWFVRVVNAKRFAGKQRAIDLEKFRQLKADQR
jgi:hypothetical protein